MFPYTYDAFLKIVLFVNNKHERTRSALIWFFTAVRWLDTSYNVAYTAVVVSIPRMLYDPLVIISLESQNASSLGFPGNLCTYVNRFFNCMYVKTDMLYGFFKQHGNIDIKNRITMFSS